MEEMISAGGQLLCNTERLRRFGSPTPRIVQHGHLTGAARESGDWCSPVLYWADELRGRTEGKRAREERREGRREGQKSRHGALDLRHLVDDRISRVGEAALAVLDHEALAGRD